MPTTISKTLLAKPNPYLGGLIAKSQNSFNLSKTVGEQAPADVKKNRIIKIQEGLIKAGHDLGKTGADGIWGNKTEMAYNKEKLNSQRYEQGTPLLPKQNKEEDSRNVPTKIRDWAMRTPGNIAEKINNPTVTKVAEVVSPLMAQMYDAIGLDNEKYPITEKSFSNNALKVLQSVSTKDKTINYDNIQKLKDSKTPGAEEIFRIIGRANITKSPDGKIATINDKYNYNDPNDEMKKQSLKERWKGGNGLFDKIFRSAYYVDRNYIAPKINSRDTVKDGKVISEGAPVKINIPLNKKGSKLLPRNKKK